MKVRDLRRSVMTRDKRSGWNISSDFHHEAVRFLYGTVELQDDDDIFDRLHQLGWKGFDADIVLLRQRLERRIKACAYCRKNIRGLCGTCGLEWIIFLHGCTCTEKRMRCRSPMDCWKGRGKGCQGPRCIELPHRIVFVD